MAFAFEKKMVKDNVLYIDIKGEIGSTNEVEFRKKLFETIESGTNQIIIDFKETTYLNSTGLGVLAASLKKVRNANGNIVIMNLNKNIRILFEITKLDTIFKIYDDLDSAINFFNE